jgi:hypothetical protein
MTVGQLQARLRDYPLETKILILVTTADGQRGINIMPELIGTFVRPDFETVPSSVLLVPEHELGQC